MSYKTVSGTGSNWWEVAESFLNDVGAEIITNNKPENISNSYSSCSIKFSLLGIPGEIRGSYNKSTPAYTWTIEYAGWSRYTKISSILELTSVLYSGDNFVIFQKDYGSGSVSGVYVIDSNSVIFADDGNMRKVINGAVDPGTIVFKNKFSLSAPYDSAKVTMSTRVIESSDGTYPYDTELPGLYIYACGTTIPEYVPVKIGNRTFIRAFGSLAEL